MCRKWCVFDVFAYAFGMFGAFPSKEGFHNSGPAAKGRLQYWTGKAVNMSKMEANTYEKNLQ